MKKILLLFISAFIFTTSFAQTETHMTFKGIPIDGHLDEFIEILEKDGFTLSQIHKGVVGIMKGEFIGKTCEVYVVSSPKTNTVWKVTVYLPEQSSWYVLKSSYNDMKEKYTIKYGQPSSDYNFFSSPYEEGDGDEMTAVSVGKCHYSTYWKLPEGYINTSISKYNQITLSYEDDLNLQINRKEMNEKVMNDI